MLVKNRKLAGAFSKYLKKAAQLEELLFVLSKDKNERLYQHFIDPQGANALNLKSRAIKQAQAVAKEVAAGTTTWDDRRLTQLIKDAKISTIGLIEDSHLRPVNGGFYMSKDFQKIHKPGVQPQLLDINKAIAVMTKKIDKKRLQILGFEKVKDKNLLNNVQKMAAYLLVGDNAKARNAYDEVVKLDANSMGAKTPFNKMDNLLVMTKTLPEKKRRG